MTALWIAVTAVCLLGLPISYNAMRISEPPLNYNGARRLNCPDNAHVGNQPTDRTNTSSILMKLRLEMSRVIAVKAEPLDGYIVTSDDDHQSETVAARDMRREYLTGFFGSAGDAIVTKDKAILWTDGRYYIQANNQLDCNWMLMKQSQVGTPTIPQWLKHEFRDQRRPARIGADPTLVPAYIWSSWEEQLENSTVKLVGVQNNLIDSIWKEPPQPTYNTYPAYVLPDEYTGQPWQEKVQQVRLEMELLGADALVVTALDEIAWLFNIRGYDLPNTPVLRSYALITHGSVHLYAPHLKIPHSVDKHLKTDSCYHADCVKKHNYTAIWYDLRTMAQAWHVVWLPSPCGEAQGASKEIYETIPPEKRLLKASPIIALRAEKNEVEAQGMERAHIRDGIAMCEFLSYMEEQINLGTQGWDEMQVARVANEIRLEQDLIMGIAFPTIAGYGAHAALPHYEPINTTNVLIGTTSTLVVDSGGQYLDGTTDVTRTLHFGKPTAEQKEAYTRVLIGSIQLSSLVFPAELRTDQLDALARGPLWSAGLNYMHGTGHGIGHFLSVHEPPISVSYVADSSSPECSAVQLKPGFFLSNEPGYYKEGNFGVRLENVLKVEAVQMPNAAGQKFLRFRDMTLVPYEPKLIDVEMLSPEHRRWLNAYNKRIREELGTELKKRLLLRGFQWMMEKTRSIPEWGPVDRDVFLGLSHANPSNFQHCHILPIAILIYHLCSGIRSIIS